MINEKIYYEDNDVTIGSINCYAGGSTFPLRNISSVRVVKGIWFLSSNLTYFFLLLAVAGGYGFYSTLNFYFLLPVILPFYDFLWRRTEYHLEIETGGGISNSNYIATTKGYKKNSNLFEIKDAIVEAMNEINSNQT